MIDRRTLLTAAGLIGLAGLGRSLWAASAPASPQTRPIPVTGERLPVIGMGSWITFNVDSAFAMDRRAEVLAAFFEHGGGLVDSSPMYGRSEAVIGHALRRLGYPQGLFAATKVWTWGRDSGIRQMKESAGLWGLERFDLLQVHNLLDHEVHLETLAEWKATGRVRHVGITTSHGRRHAELERLMETQPLDFVQLTYNLVDREAEARLLPLAAERGIAVIANRPFQGGALFRRVRGQPLPAWAAEFDCTSWAAFFLKFIVGHPAVTCAIPATSQVAHMHENMRAGYGRLPGLEERARMARLVEEL